MIKIYGIPNCDTIKKAKKWLETNELAYEFHNYKKDGVPNKELKKWVDDFGWEVILNKRGTTWRKLDDDVKGNIDNASAIEIMIANASIIKRPILVGNKKILIGFKEEEYQALLL